MPRGKPTVRSRNFRGARRRRSNVSNRGLLTEIIPINLKLGTSVNILVSNITSRPGQRNFRFVDLRVTTTHPFSPGNASGSDLGAFCPGAVQCLLMDPSGREVSTSSVVVLGSQPKSAICRYPRSGDWYQYDHPANSIIGRISAVCLGTPANSDATPAFLRGMVYLRIRYQQEIDAPACPAPNFVLGEDPSDEEGYITCT